MSTIVMNNFLQRVLWADAVASGATGALALFGGGFLSSFLGLPEALLRGAGLILLPYVAYVIWAATRQHVAPVAVWLIIAANALWALASFALLAGGFVSPNVLGYAFVIAQAIVVGVFGELQFMALRRPTVATG